MRHSPSIGVAPNLEADFLEQLVRVALYGLQTLFGEQLIGRNGPRDVGRCRRRRGSRFLAGFAATAAQRVAPAA